MAAAMTSPDVVVRAAQPGEGRAIAALWRELWDAHEAWGGYAGSHDARIYDQLAVRLEEDARVRGGQPVLGRHIHLVSAIQRDVTGQVEGWIERHGVDEATPNTCEVRSLIVRAAMRGTGAGRKLLEALASMACSLGRGTPAVLVAEVLEPNPARTFYDRMGYLPISWTGRIPADSAERIEAEVQRWERGPVIHARVAEARDALAIAVLDGTLAARRRAAGDVRFDRPRAVDATLVGAIAAHLARPGGPLDPIELVAVDTHGDVRASATLAVASLDPPFLPAKRAILGRFALDPAGNARHLLPPLLVAGCRIAAQRGATTVELTDLSAPKTPIYAAAVACGAAPWSRLVSKYIPGMTVTR